MLSRCTRRLASYCTIDNRVFRDQCRHTSGSSHFSRGDDLGPLREEAHQTFRIRKEGVGNELPLPPLLDPLVIEKKSRWRNTKNRPNPAEFTPFQKKLQANPYAHALASPVRQCRSTMILLPDAFLTTLHVRPHPTTNDPWLLPISLTNQKKHLGPPLRFLERRIVTSYLGKARSWSRALYPHMMNKLSGLGLKKMVWREDMPDLVCDLMQKEIVRKLSWYFTWKGALTPVSSPRQEDTDHVDDVSCVLAIGSLRTRADSLTNVDVRNVTLNLDSLASHIAKRYQKHLDPHASSNVTHASPPWYSEPLIARLKPRLRFPEPEFRTTYWRGKKIPVYSLTDLLGKDRVQQLMEGSRYQGARYLVIKQTRNNVPIGLLLMRLQAYVALPVP